MSWGYNINFLCQVRTKVVKNRRTRDNDKNKTRVKSVRENEEIEEGRGSRQREEDVIHSADRQRGERHSETERQVVLLCGRWERKQRRGQC